MIGDLFPTKQPLRVLSLWEPWATLMAPGEKRFETRSWTTSYRGLVCIHAAKKPIDFDEVMATPPFGAVLQKHAITQDKLGFGHVLAVGKLNCIIKAGSFASAMSDAGCEWEFGDYSAGRFAWHFPDLKRLDIPIPLRASQGLFGAPPELRAAVAEQMPGLALLEL